MKPTRRDYCQFLISSQTNYTQTWFADHHQHFSHDAINRYLQNDDVTPGDVWKQAKGVIETSPDGFLVFDDSVSDKNHSHKMELVRLQYSGNEHRLIKGIGIVNCLYVDPQTKRYWIIDWRVYEPDIDAKSKLTHMKEMFDDALNIKKLPFRVVLMDSWYATKDLMLHVHREGKIFYCPLKSNRKVDDSGGKQPYQAVSKLQWNQQEAAHGKLIKIHGFPGATKVKLFRVAITTNRTEWIVTNDLDQASTDNAKAICGIRWKIEQYHREVKQTLGIEKCQCRSAKAQRNHIGCVILAWNYMSTLAKKLKTNIYNLKKGMLSAYMRQELAQPSVLMAFV
ncbi:transposase [Verminephrobacter aporrectodeae subsp. tuberculatae]|uniref:Transposase n=1 Tax=Verminephrobacter aporrectodeae subsp. tuberculatae TaxID=1110392 RepID=A0ABT3KXD1_9BURK|nr:transposase [Verminephrobacter aporrectodeae]MCW5221328.1 transposase [Verminephrobacter aporrectodeae subsp. tuberculatae]MCW5256016.1 transposase [Verminephrobacter aporrectodeae subsp. tuberculatae]MCW5257863.1 transposase [Verminephrobacter aporrectodeae subsp. tuberculatae]MCW5290619.1 transposase [Verminephrobacter aporrectodeae subsp. tuberculatae]MCW5322998.1 transposase [Verminephrobacter aporrectodeae subsp. tuberculatae]